MLFDKPRNPNYSAVVTELSSFVELANCNNVKAALIFGNSVIVSKSTNAGDIGLFFPVETQLTEAFCGANNLFRKPEWGNVDPQAKGFFEQHGRVKAVKFRGHKSEGFWIPLASLEFAGDYAGLKPGDEFDILNGHEICRKYIPAGRAPGTHGGKQGRMARAEDKIVDGQFRFHIDTENLRRNSHKLDPDTWISISEKWHGTSAVFANVLVKRELSLVERFIKMLGFPVLESSYGLVWSSRRVVKGVDGAGKDNADHYYGTDIWGVVGKEIADRIPKGYTLYGEIVGFTPEGGAIQKGYHYGCQPGQHRLVIYRATITNADGRILELSWEQLKQFCAKNGFEMVRTLYHGKLCNLIPSVDCTLADFRGGLAWNEWVVSHLEQLYVTGSMCPHNNNEVPAEGIVLKVDRLDEDEAYKLKSFEFLSWESKQLDSGVADMETQEGDQA